MLSSYPRKSYVIDQDNRFVWFSPEWDWEFRPMLAPDYESRRYLGANFFDLMAGPEIRTLYGSIFQALRRQPRNDFMLTLRCDMPGAKAILDLQLERQDQAAIKATFDYQLIERYGPSAPGLLAALAGPIRMCSWCQGIHVTDETGWLPIEEALGQLSLLHQEPLPVFTHACCPGCFQSIRGKTHEYTRGG